MQKNTAMPTLTHLRGPAPDEITGGSAPRMKANDARHQDRSQAQAAGLADHIQRRFTLELHVAREFDDQDSVLCREPTAQQKKPFVRC